MNRTLLTRRDLVRLLTVLPLVAGPGGAAGRAVAARAPGTPAPRATTAARATVEYRGWIVHEEDRVRLQALCDSAPGQAGQVGRIQ